MSVAVLTAFPNQRHLAQEDKMKETKSKEELEQTKSTKSLKNWGELLNSIWAVP